MNRRGFTLVELLVGSVLVGILGIALINILQGDSRFASRQDAMVSARRTARGGLNVMAPELRMVSDGGVVAVAPDSVTIRVPYAFGVVCRISSGSGYSHASIVPADSLAYASAQLGGVAWRSSSAGTYAFVAGVSVGAPMSAQCVQDSIRIVPGGQEITLSPALAAPVGSVFYLYQTVTYRFAPSVTLPGRVALWRQAGAAAAQEMVSPFDSTTGFRCLVGGSLSPVNCPPGGGVSTVRGLQLHLVGASERAPEGKSAPETFDLTTDVPFVNALGS
jgi:prepilin-type N-terminal cleavage/methylation domain-containing protein